MARRHRGDGTSQQARRGRRYTTGRTEEEERIQPDDTSWTAADDDFGQASMEDLREFADELEIEDYQSMSREELVREIRRETRAEP